MGEDRMTSVSGGPAPGDELAARIERIEREVGARPAELAGPVGWMLSPELVANLRSILRRFTDPRRWMWLDHGRTHVEDGGPRAGRWLPLHEPGPPSPTTRIEPASLTAAVDSAVAREVAYTAAIDPAVAAADVATPKELWFDYAADIGDGVAAMYSSAYLLQADLAVVGATSLPDASAVIAARAAGHPIALEVVGPGAPAPQRLPRGEFLFVGGDTAYHVADLATIATRVQAPFTWAARDLMTAGQWDPRPRRIYGIPGNHDWYDELDGYSRLFRRAAAADREKPETDLRKARYDASRPVDLIGFDRVQHASYVSIALPFGWQLWGLDIDQPIDERQRRYFRSLCRTSDVGAPVPPAKLVVCTPSPPIVFGKIVADERHDDAMRAIGLPRLYASTDDANPQPAGACRLDLSGDVHHYARYPAPWDPLPRDAPATADVDDRSYQAVVSGLGGAFLHPSDTTLGAHRPVTATVFPSSDASRKETARGTSFYTLWRGGWLRGIPILLTLLFSWVWLQDGMARSVGDWILEHLGFHLQQTLWGPEGLELLTPVGPGRLAAFGIKSAVLILGVGLMVLGFRAGRRAAAARARDPGLRRGYWAPTWFAGGGLAVLIMGPVLFESSWRHGLTIDTLVMLLLITLPFVAGGATGKWLGARLAGARRWLGALFGAVHVAVQLVTMVILTRIALSAPHWSALAIAGYLLANHALAPKLTAASWSPATRTAVIAAAWLLLIAGLWTVILAGAHHRPVYPAGWPQQALLMIAAPLAAMFLGCAHFGWYLALMSSLGFHNNELGGAARVDRYRQFIRFRVTEHALTGYVIGLDGVVADDQNGTVLRPLLLDVFTIEPRKPVVTPAAGPTAASRA